MTTSTIDQKIKLKLKPVYKDKIVLKNNLTTNIVTSFIQDQLVTYQGKAYWVISIPTESNGIQYNMPIIVDYEDYKEVKKYNWHRIGKYAGYNYYTDENLRHAFYLHQFIIYGSEKNNKLTIDHINRIGQDNRKENLRKATQTEQNHNRKKVSRSIKLPDDCGFNGDDVPQYIDYHGPSGSHGAHFEVVIKQDGKKVHRQKSSKSKLYTLIQKLNQAKLILKDLMEKKPEWFKDKCINGKLSDEGDKLYESYFEILKLAGINDPFNNYVNADKRNQDYLDINMDNIAEYKSKDKNMPNASTGINKLPMYCRYIDENASRGCYFEYDHKDGDNRICHRTSQSKNITIQDKYNEIITKLTSLQLLKW